MPRCHTTAAFAMAAALFGVACGGDEAGPAGADAAPLADADPAAARWLDLAPIAAGPVQEIGVAALDGRVYVVGGIDDRGGTVDDLLVYEPEADAWSAAAPLPAPLHHVNVAAYQGRLYVLGGLRPSFGAVGSAWVYDPEDDAWSAIAPMPAGTERGAGAVGVVGDRIVVAGGEDAGGALATVSAYVPATDSWDQELPSLPAARNHLMGAVVGDTLHVIGGRGAGIDDVAAEVFALPAGAGAWQTRAPMPTARGGAAAGVVGGEIIVVGGEGNAAASSGVFAQAEAYDPVADQWRALPDMSVPRHGMGAAGIGERLYVPGGATVQAFGATDAHQALAF